MKISVCIPIYNFDVRKLVDDLKIEIKLHAIEAEIILIDDASNEKFIQINSGLREEVEQFILLENNIGRSRIRNLFPEYAKGQFLLFLDCDGKIVSADFLNNYINFLHRNPGAQVIYGGRTISDVPASDNHLLRWKFAVERENLPLRERLKKPFLSFQTNNFLIKKNVLEKIRFNDYLQKYGYEDLIFAMDLKSGKIPVDHVDNPVFNDDVEESSVYLRKAEDSVENLLLMLKDPQISLKLSEIKLAKAYRFVVGKRLRLPFLFIFKIFKNSLRKNLLSQNPHLSCLDFYKLGLMMEQS